MGIEVIQSNNNYHIQKINSFTPFKKYRDAFKKTDSI